MPDAPPPDPASVSSPSVPPLAISESTALTPTAPRSGHRRGQRNRIAVASTPLKAIETRYAGCRFRSRLEARWAVFLDHLMIRWEYEPEGFELPGGLRYLPDFFLPDLDIHAEVKGSQEALNRDLDKICSFAAAADTNVVVLGEVADARTDRGTPMHTMIVSGKVSASLVMHLRVGGRVQWFFAPVSAPVPATTSWFNWGGIAPWPELADAYQAARSARFEFGEQG